MWNSRLIEIKRKLGLNPLDIINSKQQTVLGDIKYAFEGGDMQTEHSVLNYRVDLYFYGYKFAIKLMNLDIAREILTMK